MLGGAGRNPSAHPDVVPEVSLASCIPAVKQYLLQLQAWRNRLVWISTPWAIRPYHWSTGSYWPWRAVEGVERRKARFCFFDKRPSWAGLLAKGTRRYMTSQSQERYQDNFPIHFYWYIQKPSFLGGGVLSFSHYYLNVMEEYCHRGIRLIVSIHY